MDHGKRQVRPWNLFSFQQRDFQTFSARAEFRLVHDSAKNDVHLVDLGNAEDRVELGDLDRSVGLFQGFARSRVFHGLIHFHKSRGERPEPIPWFDGSFAEQDTTLPFGNTTHHDFGIFVMNGRTLPTYQTGQGISVGDLGTEGRSTSTAIVHHVSHRPGIGIMRRHVASAIPSTCSFLSGVFE